MQGQDAMRLTEIRPKPGSDDVLSSVSSEKKGPTYGCPAAVNGRPAAVPCALGLRWAAACRPPVGRLPVVPPAARRWRSPSPRPVAVRRSSVYKCKQEFTDVNTGMFTDVYECTSVTPPLSIMGVFPPAPSMSGCVRHRPAAHPVFSVASAACPSSLCCGLSVLAPAPFGLLPTRPKRGGARKVISVYSVLLRP